MKKLITMILMATLIQSNAHALLFNGTDMLKKDEYGDVVTVSFYATTSLPTFLIQTEGIDYNSPYGKAFLIQEAQNVMEGKKSLIIKDDEASKENGKTALEKAELILNELSE